MDRPRIGFRCALAALVLAILCATLSVRAAAGSRQAPPVRLPVVAGVAADLTDIDAGTDLVLCGAPWSAVGGLRATLRLLPDTFPVAGDTSQRSQITRISLPPPS